MPGAGGAGGERWGSCLPGWGPGSPAVAVASPCLACTQHCLLHRDSPGDISGFPPMERPSEAQGPGPPGRAPAGQDHADEFAVDVPATRGEWQGLTGPRTDWVPDGPLSPERSRKLCCRACMFLGVLRFLTVSPSGAVIAVTVLGEGQGCHDPSAFENWVWGTEWGCGLQVHPECRDRGAAWGSRAGRRGRTGMGCWGHLQGPWVLQTQDSMPGPTRPLGTHKSVLTSFKVRRRTINV